MRTAQLSFWTLTLLALTALQFSAAPAAAAGCTVDHDVDMTGIFDGDDPLYLLEYLFNGGPAPLCPAEADANGDGSTNIADPIFMLNELACGSAILGDVNGSGVLALADVDYLLDYLFTGGPAPVPCNDVADVNGDGKLSLGDATTLLATLPCPSAIAGDADGDEDVDLADALRVTQYLFGGGPAPEPCVLAGDITGDGSVGIGDVSFYFSYLF